MAGLAIAGLVALVTAVGVDALAEPPQVDGLTPHMGSVEGGTKLIIWGHRFDEVSAVMFGSVPAASFERLDGSRIAAVAPAHSVGNYVVTVTSDGQTSPEEHSCKGPHCRTNEFKFIGVRVDTITPASGPKAGGTPATVTGVGFVPGAGAMAFHFGKAGATSVECQSETECTLVTPAQKKAGAQAVIASYGKIKSKRGGAPSFTYE